MLQNPKQNLTKLKNIPLEKLQRGAYQPRQQFDPAKLAILAASIREHGMMQPLVVRPLLDGQDKYEIIAGERRWRAAQLIGLHEVPCLMGDYADASTAQMALIENLIRADLNVIEKAKGIARLIAEFNYTHEVAADHLGLSRPEITNLLRLLKLDTAVQQLLMAGDLTESHGKLLAGVPQAQQYAFARQTIAKRWSIRALETAIKKRDPAQLSHAAADVLDVNQAKLMRALSDHLGLPLKFKTDANNKGYLQLHFNNLDELEGLLDKMGFGYE